MSRLMPDDILDDVRVVMSNVRHEHENESYFVTAYQVLARLPAAVRERLIQERGMPGAGSGVSYSSASLVSSALKNLARAGEIEIAYMDCVGVMTKVNGQTIIPGYEVCGLYRRRT